VGWQGAFGPQTGTGRPAVADKRLGAAVVVPDESETATAPARMKLNANPLITIFIVGNLDR
jgi:hypothetical protein